jgi:gamma-glutamyltranspeptidase / glutathione hydrolase
MKPSALVLRLNRLGVVVAPALWIGLCAAGASFGGGCGSATKPQPAPAGEAPAASAAAAEGPATAPAAAATPAPPPAPAPTAGPTTGPDDGGARAAAAAKATDVAEGKAGAVTSASAEATAVGLEILKKGGNAVDAAVAVGFALGVSHPTAGNIGGGGFMIIRTADGKAVALDYREMAPRGASSDMYLNAKGEVTKDSRQGPRAAGIPGDVAGFEAAHKRFGKLKWRDVVMPAAALAKDGIVLDSYHAEDLQWGAKSMTDYLAALEADPASKPALREALRKTLALVQRPDGTPFQAGDRWVQPDLAATLTAIANGGAKAFYRGALAQKMAKQVQAMGGLWTAQDLAGYRVVDRKPVMFEYRGNQVITMPPPSAGGITLRQVLGADEILGLKEMPWASVERIHLYIEALRRIYADRNLLVADPDFVKVPVDRLLDIKYLATRLGTIDHAHATPSADVGAGVEIEEKPQTTHFSVMDGSGMAVANTFTLNGGFGAKVQIPGTGVTLNNEMDDFTAKVGSPNMFGLVQGPQNAIAPGKRMLSSMTPTIVVQGGKVRLVCGSPGGPTITTTVAQVIMQVIDYGIPLDQAIAAGRIHHQWMPDTVFQEGDLPAATVKALEAMGHKISSRGRIGHANCIEANAAGELRAVADTARDGGDAAAY